MYQSGNSKIKVAGYVLVMPSLTLTTEICVFGYGRGSPGLTSMPSWPIRFDYARAGTLEMEGDEATSSVGPQAERSWFWWGVSGMSGVAACVALPGAWLTSSSFATNETFWFLGPGTGRLLSASCVPSNFLTLSNQFWQKPSGAGVNISLD